MQQNKVTNKREQVGVVVSDDMSKTVVVQTERRVLNKQFKKYLAQRKKYLAHDEKEECKLGDVVKIQESRRFSKRKCWKVIEVLQQGFGKETDLKDM